MPSILTPKTFDDPFYRRGFSFPEEVLPLQSILCTGQMRSDDTFHNVSWYNRDGEKIGWGDLSQSDLLSIPELLPEGELFVVVYESVSHWEFKRRNPDGDPARPGVAWLVENATWVATRTGWFAYPSDHEDGECVGVRSLGRAQATKAPRSHLAALFSA